MNEIVVNISSAGPEIVINIENAQPEFVAEIVGTGPTGPTGPAGAGVDLESLTNVEIEELINSFV